MKTTEDFYDIIDKYMGYIQLIYKKHEDEKPIIEISLPACKIYVYYYFEYLKTLSERSQKMLEKEYNEARKNNKMVVFVKDNETKTLKSSSFPIEEIEVIEREY